MLAVLGQTALLAALAVALVLGTLPIAGAARGRGDWIALARPAAQLHCVLVGAAFACLAAAFALNDFSLAYVAAHSNRALPLAYRITAVWGGHEGSLLLWLALQGLWMLALARLGRELPAAFLARSLGVLGLLGAGLLVFVLATSNPFGRIDPVPLDGRDLNPLLQDPGMAAHPPLLYMGYVGFSVAFAFAVAALLEGKLDSAWARWARPWTTAAWCFLTLGIALGSFWAYYELGWGGWWFWDPVENAAFMPWLAGTALIHSLAVTEKRAAFKAWTVLLALLAFSLALLGTFLVRSGVLASVHAFASDPARGLFILALLAVAVGGALALYAWRAPRLGAGGRFALLSRESLLLGNNLLLLVALGSVLLGTLYPLALDALGLGRISVGAPYFETVLLPIMALLALLLGVGPLARWRETAALALAHRVRWVALAALPAALLTGWLAGRIGLTGTLGFAMAYWIAGGIAVDLAERLRHAKRNGPAGSAVRMRLLPRAALGMIVAHLGVAVFAFGVSMVRGFEVERELQMAPGDATELAGYRFAFHGVQPRSGANFEAVQALVEVTRGDRPVALLYPEKRVYRMQRNPMTEAAIDAGATRDLYVALGAPLAGGAWTLRIAFKPFVRWIWGGCLLMVLGGALAASDRRLRVRQPQARTQGAATVLPARA